MHEEARGRDFMALMQVSRRANSKLARIFLKATVNGMTVVTVKSKSADTEERFFQHLHKSLFG